MIIGKSIVLTPSWPDAVPGSFAPAALERTPGPRFLRETASALLRTLAARDPYTGQHSNRVTKLAVRFAGFLELSAQDVQTLRNAVFLHDIGKIGISDAILLKPGPLTPEERKIINTHPLIGGKIVEPLGLASKEREIILFHHERWDGRGYPQGLAGDDIPFLARLTALADVYDALVTDRPYRRRFTSREALQEIARQAGKQFDPHLAQEFMEFISPLASCMRAYQQMP